MKKLITCLATVWLLHAAPAAAAPCELSHSNVEAEGSFAFSYPCFWQFLITTGRAANQQEALGESQLGSYVLGAPVLDRLHPGCGGWYNCVTDDQERLLLLDWKVWAGGQRFRSIVSNVCVQAYDKFKVTKPTIAALLAESTSDCNDAYEVNKLIVLHDL